MSLVINGGHFDYVVVGAGSAGCVLAGRLSEDPDVRVLVLEAGGSDDLPDVQMPAVFHRLFKTRHDWDYSTGPEPQLDGRALYWPQGKLVGGSSSMNAMLYIRGNRLDYDSWRDQFGCAGWGYDDLLPYFIRSEDFQDGPDEFHGVGGPLRVENLRAPHQVSEAFIEAAVSTGLVHNLDFNGAQQEGAGMFQVTQKSGRRWSAADAFLHPARRRANLTVRTDARVEQLLISDGTATGVRYRQGGVVVDAHAECEVLLAAGAVGSPRILMLSGIGPAVNLHAVGVTALHDSPDIGGRLQDHPVLPLQWYTPGLADVYSEDNTENRHRWSSGQMGPLTSSVAEAGAFIRTDLAKIAPDLQFQMMPALMRRDRRSDAALSGMSMGAVVADVASRGRVSLVSADPDRQPLISGCYLSEQSDRDTMLASFEFAHEFASAAALRPYLGDMCLPGADSAGTPGREAYLRKNVQTNYHPTSTVAMGPSEDDPLDLELRVRGIDRLRVVDASAMPRIPRGNTNAPTIALAERAVDLIRRSGV
jgi:choline dehydrogenase